MANRYDEAEDYVLGFTCVEENGHSAKLIFGMKKLRLLEASHTGASSYAFPRFKPYNDQIYDQALELVSMENYRSHEVVRRYGHPGTRRLVVEELKKCIKANPAFEGKLEPPSLHTMISRLLAARTKTALWPDSSE